jgi:hypothetical protein
MKNLAAIFLVLCTFFLSLASYAQDESIPPEYTLRKALNFPDQALPDMDDQAFLEILALASEVSGLESANQIDVHLYNTDINFIYYTDEVSLFVTCHYHGKDPHCLGPKAADDPTIEFFWSDRVRLFEATLDMSIINSTEIIESDRFNARTYFIYAGAVVVTYYGAKKLFNKLKTGSWRASDDHHSHFFKTVDEVEHELEHLSEFVHHYGHELTEGIENQDKLFKDIADDIFQMGLQLAQESAACSHGHCDHGHDHAHELHEAVVKHHKNFAIDLATDFYRELVAPAVRLAKGMTKPFNRKQLWQFIELSAIKSVKERGLITSIATGVFVVSGQAVAETVESLIMPAGVHVLCQVGNALVLGVAATAYTGYFCIKNLKELKGLKFADKWRVIGQSLKIQWKARAFTSRPVEKLGEISSEDKLYLSLKLLHMNTEKQLRYARSLDQVDVKLSRKIAAELGELQKQLDLIGLHLRASQYREDTTLEQQILTWYQKLHEVQENLALEEHGHHHHHHHEPILKEVSFNPVMLEQSCAQLLMKLAK